MAGRQERGLAPARASADRMVGRDAELVWLRECWALAVAGEPVVAVVAGETGIGKTRLVGALLDDRDVTGHAAACVPVVGPSLPFAPVGQLLRRLPPRTRDRLPDGWPARAGELPAESGRAGADELSGTTQLRLFETLLSVLAETAADRPVALVVEDLHWADPSTLDLLAFLTRSLHRDRLLLVLTARTDDLPSAHPLRGWLAELGRVPAVRRLDLARLDRDATREQVRDLRGSPPGEELVDLLHRRSAGNPLFTRELLPWAEEGRLPDSLRDLLRTRVQRLADRTRTLLDRAAVVGPRAPLDVLAELVGSREEEVEDGLAPAVADRVLRGEDDAVYAFAHPLLREVVHADLPPGRRRRLHADLARILARRRAAGQAVPPAEVARHWAAAGDDDELFRWSVEAGLDAERAYAFADVTGHLGRAVALAGARPDAAFAALPVDRVGLMEHAAQAAHLTGDGARAVELVDQALDRCGDGLRRGRLLERKGTFCVNAGLPDDAEQAYRAALEQLPPGSLADRARVHAGLAMLTMAWSRFEEAEGAAGEAIRLARLSGARREEGRALNALGVVAACRGDAEEGTRLLEESLGIAGEVADPDDLAAAYIDLAHVLGLANELDRAVEVCRRGIVEMARVGLARQEGAFLRANAAESLTKAGRWDEASVLLEEAQRYTGDGLRAYPVLVESARLSLCRGDLDDADRHVARLRTMLSELGLPVQWRRELGELCAELALWRRRPSEALQLVEDTLGAVAGTDEADQTGQLLWLGLRAAADLTEEHRAGGEREDGAVEAGRRLGALLTSTAAEAQQGAHLLPDGEAVAVTAVAELSRLEGVRDPAPWTASACAWERVRRALPALYCRWREAEALVLSRPASAERSVRLLREVHARSAALGARMVVEEVQRLATWARVGLADGEPLEGGTRELDEIGLTARELEVLAGLVAGRTNGEIAASLFISTKTASVHVSNILRKLGVANRTEAAQRGHRLGLAAGGPR